MFLSITPVELVGKHFFYSKIFIQKFSIGIGSFEISMLFYILKEAS